MAKNSRNTIAVLAVFAIIMVIVVSTFTGAYSEFTNSISGYSSAFQGPKARFYGLIDENGQKVTNNQYPSGTSLHQFDTVLHYDKDGSDSGKPKIQGEMTTVFLPEDTTKNAASWLPTSWMQNNGLIANPVKTYPWVIGDTTYKMDQYTMRYYVTFSAEWAGSEVQGFSMQNNYGNTQIWVEMDLTPTWYIEGGGTAYFAIGKMQLAEDAIYQGRNNAGQTVEARKDVSVSPESRSSPVYLYSQAFGAEQVQEKTAYSYQGKKLNPDLFTDKMFFHVDLNKFGVYWGADYLFFPWQKGDTVTLAFDVTAFCIGEYTVKDIQENPSQYGRFTKEVDTTPAFLTWLFETPAGNAFLGLIILAVIVFIIIVAVIVYAPGIAIAFMGLIGARKK